MIAIDTLLIDRSPGETRVAVLAGDDVVEVHHHRNGEPGAGALYRGRVGAPLPDASSVFVEISLERPAFMPCGGRPPPEGQEVNVKIVQPPHGDKGAKVRLADAKQLAKSDIPTGPGLITPAQHIIAWCVETYAQTLTHVVLASPDRDGTVNAMLSSALSISNWTARDDLFDYYAVEEAIERALAPVVPFHGGGKLIIEPTAAFTAVDIDAGPMPAGEANLAAISKLAEELRLRAVAGPIIVDLIPSRGRTAVVEKLKQLVARDPVPTQVAGLTPEGRIELNRRRLRPSLAHYFLASPNASEPTVDSVAYTALRRCVHQGLVENATRLTLKAHADVIALLQGRLRSALDEAESTLKMPITLESASGSLKGWPKSKFDIET